jgi:DNA-directed RNA polymerase subunit F
MIKEKKPLAMYEVENIINGIEETDKTKEIKIFIKKFIKANNEKSKKIKDAVEKLNIIKLREIDILKVADMVPESAVELNKIVTEASLDEDETNKILDAIKNNK